MRKVIMLNRMSIDGYFASLNEANFGMDWFIHDPEIDKVAHEMTGKTDTLILGSKTYRGFEQSWTPLLKDPNAPKELKAVAEELTQLNKMVFSKSLKESDWQNTKIFDGDIIKEVRKLKQLKGENILIMGSGTIVQQLANEALIDEYMFIVTPVVAGEGKSLFHQVKQFGLTLKSVTSFDSGNVLIKYELKK